MVTVISGVWLPNKTSTTYQLIVLTVALAGAKKVVNGFFLIFIATFSRLILSFDDTMAF